MSRAVIWTALGLFLLNLGALIGWAAAFRPRLVLTSDRDTRPSSVMFRMRVVEVVGRARDRMAHALRRIRTAVATARPVPTPRAVDAVVERPDETRSDSPRVESTGDAALERWLAEMDAGDRAETSSADEDPDQLWRAWAESHGPDAAGGGNDPPRAAGSGRPRRGQRHADAGLSA